MYLEAKILKEGFTLKIKALAITLIFLMIFMVGCARQQQSKEEPRQETPKQTTPPESTPDVKTTASIVDDEEAFEKAMSKEGSWIICALKDMTFDKEIVLDGVFKNGKKDEQGNDIIQRKIALYTQDENRNVTEEFTLTAPKLTINSPNARIQHGTFKGDIYVNAENFELVDTDVEGNVYFMNEKAQETFKMDEKSKITGVKELKKD